MDLAGLALCSRYSYPPNSLSLCGPDKKRDLNWYSIYQRADKGTLEILSEFSTLYPYLSLIAQENKIKDPFDQNVVEAYWIGNDLLHKIPVRSFVTHLSDKLQLKKKIKREELEHIYSKITDGVLPNHSFHVTNIYQRTGHLDIPYTLETMDACLINWGKIKKINKKSLIITTNPLSLIDHKLQFDKLKERTIISQGDRDILMGDLKIGDLISHHWGYFCKKLSQSQLKNLIYYNNLSVNFANRPQ